MLLWRGGRTASSGTLSGRTGREFRGRFRATRLRLESRCAEVAHGPASLVADGARAATGYGSRAGRARCSSASRTTLPAQRQRSPGKSGCSSSRAQEGDLHPWMFLASSFRLRKMHYTQAKFRILAGEVRAKRRARCAQCREVTRARFRRTCGMGVRDVRDAISPAEVEPLLGPKL